MGNNCYLLKKNINRVLSRVTLTNKINPTYVNYFWRYIAVNIRAYIEVSKPRIVVVLVITAVASLLGATRFDQSPDIPWDVSIWHLNFLVLAGPIASLA